MYIKIGLVISTAILAWMINCYIKDEKKGIISFFKENIFLVVFEYIIFTFFWGAIFLAVFFSTIVKFKVHTHIKYFIVKNKKKLGIIAIILLALFIIMKTAGCSTIRTKLEPKGKPKITEYLTKDQLDIKLQAEKNFLLEKMKYKLLKRRYGWLNKYIYNIIKYECKKNKLKEEFVCALIQYESSGVVYAKSHSGARGLMQIMAKYHYKGRNPNNLYNIRLNIRIGCRYLAYCKKRAGGNLTISLKNYNSGPNSRFYNWPYIKRILRAYNKSIWVKKIAEKKLIAKFDATNKIDVLKIFVTGDYYDFSRFSMQNL